MTTITDAMYAKVAEGSAFNITARCDIDRAVTGFVQSAISTITLNAYPVGSSTAEYTDTLTLADVVFDTLQTDWDEDDTGYNFDSKIPATALTAGKYRIEVLVTPTSGAASAFIITRAINGQRLPFMVHVVDQASV